MISGSLEKAPLDERGFFFARARAEAYFSAWQIVQSD